MDLKTIDENLVRDYEGLVDEVFIRRIEQRLYDLRNGILDRSNTDIPTK